MGFFKRLKKEVWKVIRGILILGVIVMVVISVVTYGRRIKRPDTVEMILDSDSGNEIDDLYAITLALIDPKINLIGLTSAQWNMHPGNSNDSTVYISQKINEKLLELHDRLDIPHPIGEEKETGNLWYTPAPISPAAQFIIDEAHKVKYGERLNVVTLGAVSNLARAIREDSTIIPKIRWYGICLQYNERDRIWNKNEFNTRNDLDGIDMLLNCEAIETHIMTATSSKVYTFDQAETFDLLRNRGPKWDYLVDRWVDYKFESKSWIMWDVALIQAIMNPDLVTKKQVWTPSENSRRRINVYTWIDELKMKREFRKLIRKEMQDISSDIE